MQPDLFRPDTNDLERRSAEIEVRAAQDGKTLYGYASVFDKPTIIAGYTETVRSGAFKRSLASGRDILLLFNHDPALVLSRTRNGSLKLAEDSKGLHFEATPAETSAGRDCLALCRAGSLGGMSFGFEDRAESWKGRTRELVDLELYEISAISSFSAYSSTEIFVRSATGKGRSRLTLARAFLETVRG